MKGLYWRSKGSCKRKNVHSLLSESFIKKVSILPPPPAALPDRRAENLLRSYSTDKSKFSKMLRDSRRPTGSSLLNSASKDAFSNSFGDALNTREILNSENSRVTSCIRRPCSSMRRSSLTCHSTRLSVRSSLIISSVEREATLRKWLSQNDSAPLSTRSENAFMNP